MIIILFKKNITKELEQAELEFLKMQVKKLSDEVMSQETYIELLEQKIDNSKSIAINEIINTVSSELVKKLPKDNKRSGGEIIIHDSGNKSPWTFQQKENIRKTITKTHELLSKLESEVSDNRSNLTKEIDDIEHNIQVNLNLIKGNQIKLHNQNQIAIKKLEVVQKENAKRLVVKFNSLITDLKESKHKMTIDSKENVDDVIKELGKFYDIVMKTLSDKQLEEVMKNVNKK